MPMREVRVDVAPPEDPGEESPSYYGWTNGFTTLTEP
jgi:hypothetical protein